LAKYLEAADHVLNLAIATRPTAPIKQKRRISLANPAGFVAHIVLNGGAVLLKNKQPDPDFPPAGEHRHIDQAAHEAIGSFRNGSGRRFRLRLRQEQRGAGHLAREQVASGSFATRTSPSVRTSWIT
jgi:hypothetical protein